MQKRIHELIYAISFFTRLPVPHLKGGGAVKLHHTFWVWPFIGGMMGGVSALAYLGAWGLGMGHGVASVMAVIVPMVMTGGFHEDGLADCADSFGGTTPAQCLKIMKDSHIGGFGALALIAMILLKTQAIAQMGEQAEAGAHVAGMIVLASMLGKISMLVILLLFPLAKGKGLRAGLTGMSTSLLLISILIGFGLCAGGGWVMPEFGPGFGLGFGAGFWHEFVPAFLLLNLGLGAGIGLGFVMTRKIGGLTGDVFGGCCLMTETACLMIAVRLISS